MNRHQKRARIFRRLQRRHPRARIERAVAFYRNCVHQGVSLWGGLLTWRHLCETRKMIRNKQIGCTPRRMREEHGHAFSLCDKGWSSGPSLFCSPVNERTPEYIY